MITYEVFLLSITMAANTMGSAFQVMEDVTITQIDSWDLTLSRFVLAMCIGEELLGFFNELYS